MGLSVQSEALTQRVGATVLIGVGAMVALLLGYGRCRVERAIRAHVYFEHVEGLQEGAPVQVAGREIGTVAAITLIPRHLARGDHELLAPAGGVMVTIRVGRRYAYMAPVNGAYFLANKGVFGERYLAVGPPDDGAAPARGLRESDRVRGADPPHVDRVLVRSYRNIKIAEKFLADVGPAAREFTASLARLSVTLREVEPEPGALAAAGEAIAGSVAEARAVGDTLRRGEFEPADIDRIVAHAGRVAASLEAAIADARGRIEHIQREIERLRGAIPPAQTVRLADSLARARDKLASFEHTVAAARALWARVMQGEGTLGGLLRDPEFSDDAKQMGRILKRQPWRLIGRPRRSVD